MACHLAPQHEALNQAGDFLLRGSIVRIPGFCRARASGLPDPYCEMRSRRTLSNKVERETPSSCAASSTRPPTRSSALRMC